MSTAIALILAIFSIVTMSFVDGVKFTNMTLWSDALLVKIKAAK